MYINVRLSFSNALLFCVMFQFSRGRKCSQGVSLWRYSMHTYLCLPRIACDRVYRSVLLNDQWPNLPPKSDQTLDKINGKGARFRYAEVITTYVCLRAVPTSYIVQDVNRYSQSASCDRETPRSLSFRASSQRPNTLAWLPSSAANRTTSTTTSWVTLLKTR